MEYCSCRIPLFGSAASGGSHVLLLERGRAVLWQIIGLHALDDHRDFVPAKTDVAQDVIVQFTQGGDCSSALPV
ncbi:hypothetical protein A3753_15440 [Sulfitobacter sp. HI0082]|nr:hypothetical protein A3753_15440 [Sulfitobacter sp. HI0082]